MISIVNFSKFYPESKRFEGKSMRQIMNSQMKIGEIAIPDIELDLRSRDEIPKILIGLQSI